MKSFKQFMTEASMPDELAGGASVRQSGEGGRVYRKRKKSEAETRRVKAIGGGKTAPVTYKDRKDIGTQKKRETREQQPTKERGSAALSAKEAQRKAYKERKAREAGAKTQTASQLLTKKAPEKKTNPNYKGDANVRTTKGVYTKDEKKQIRRAGERLVRDIQKKREKPASNYNVNLKR